MPNSMGNEPRTYAEVKTRLEEIVTQVRDKDLPLEKSLDLYEEAVRLGNRCSDLIDKVDFNAAEREALIKAAENQDESAETAEEGTGEEIPEAGAEEEDQV